jgi:hypothetical protein
MTAIMVNRLSNMTTTGNNVINVILLIGFIAIITLVTVTIVKDLIKKANDKKRKENLKNDFINKTGVYSYLKKD